MSLMDSRSREIASLALNGLYQRSKAISSNTVNAMTPGYQRKDVAFEDQLQNIIKKEDEKEQMKLANSKMWQKNPAEALKNQDPAQIAFLNSNTMQDFEPEVLRDYSDPISENGNNVNLEQEMMNSAKTGTQYTVLAGLVSRSFQGLQSVIKGQ